MQDHNDCFNSTLIECIIFGLWKTFLVLTFTFVFRRSRISDMIKDFNLFYFYYHIKFHWILGLGHTHWEKLKASGKMRDMVRWGGSPIPITKCQITALGRTHPHILNEIIMFSWCPITVWVSWPPRQMEGHPVQLAEGRPLFPATPLPARLQCALPHPLPWWSCPRPA